MAAQFGLSQRYLLLSELRARFQSSGPTDHVGRQQESSARFPWAHEDLTEQRSGTETIAIREDAEMDYSPRNNLMDELLTTTRGQRGVLDAAATTSVGHYSPYERLLADIRSRRTSRADGADTQAIRASQMAQNRGEISQQPPDYAGWQSQNNRDFTRGAFRSEITERGIGTRRRSSAESLFNAPNPPNPGARVAMARDHNLAMETDEAPPNWRHDTHNGILAEIIERGGRASREEQRAPPNDDTIDTDAELSSHARRHEYLMARLMDESGKTNATGGRTVAFSERLQAALRTYERISNIPTYRRPRGGAPRDGRASSARRSERAPPPNNDDAINMGIAISRLAAERHEQLMAELTALRRFSADVHAQHAPPPTQELSTAGEARSDESEGQAADGGGDSAVASSACCAVCLESPRSYAFIPCGHRCVCRGCSRAVIGRAAPPMSPPKCPICRLDAIGVFKIFL